MRELSNRKPQAYQRGRLNSRKRPPFSFSVLRKHLEDTQEWMVIEIDEARALYALAKAASNYVEKFGFRDMNSELFKKLSDRANKFIP